MLLFARALVAFVALPGVVAFAVPWLIVRDHAFDDGFHPAGAVVLVIGLAILLWCVRDFYVLGRGTLAPWDPPRALVRRGLYRYSRNPMYVGVIFVVSGWALGFHSV